MIHDLQYLLSRHNFKNYNIYYLLLVLHVDFSIVCSSLLNILQLPHCYNGCAQKIQETAGSSIKKKKQMKF